MQATTLTVVFVLFLALSMAVRLWLASRQVRHVARHRDSVPPQFAHRVGLHAHQRAADYTVAKVKLGIVDSLISVVVVVGLTLLGGLQWLAGLWAAWLPDSQLLQQVAIVMSVVALTSLIEIPMDAWRQFRLEERFGFNRMTVRLFVSDLLKSTALAAAIGLPLLATVLWLMQKAGSGWWLWARSLCMSLILVILLIYATVIAPIFSRYQPREAGDVRTRVVSPRELCGFSSNVLSVLDGIRRSAYGNAYFTGFG